MINSSTCSGVSLFREAWINIKLATPEQSILGCFCCLTFRLIGERYVVRLGQMSILTNFEHPERSSSTSDMQLKILRHPYKVKNLSCLKVWHATNLNTCIDPHNTNPKTKSIYLSCSTRNIQKTSYFCLNCLKLLQKLGRKSTLINIQIITTKYR